MCEIAYLSHQLFMASQSEMTQGVREEDENGFASSAWEKGVGIGYTWKEGNEARSRLDDIPNSFAKLTLVRPAELIAAMRRLMSAQRKFVFLSHLSLHSFLQGV